MLFCLLFTKVVLKFVKTVVLEMTSLKVLNEVLLITIQNTQ